MCVQRLYHRPPFAARCIASGLVIVCLGTGLYFLTLRLMAQSELHQAKKYVSQEKFGLASALLKKAAALQPYDANIPKQLGAVMFKLAGYSRDQKNALRYVQKAQTYYRKAGQLNPLDADIYFELAQCMVSIRELSAQAGLPPKHTTDPLDHLRKAIALRPNSITFRYSLVKYFHLINRKDYLKSAVEKLSYIYPPIYSHLRREPFWSPEIGVEAKKGLVRAIDKGNHPREAHMALSDMAARKKDYKTAIYHYEAALYYRAFENRPEQKIHLGRLCLKDQNVKTAKNNFIAAIRMSSRRKKYITQIYHVYRNCGQHRQFLDFIEQINALFPVTIGTRILTARSLLDQKRYFKAEQTLKEINKEDQIAEAYFWLAKIAQAQKDWHAMELHAQRAAFLEPDNSRFQMLFSQVLKKVKKLAEAEEAANQALAHAIKISPWYLNHRAWIRWERRNYRGAASDWRLALSLKSNNAGFNYQLAEAYVKISQNNLALEHFQRAVSLSPGNERYRQRLSELKMNLISDKHKAVGGSG